MLATCPVNFGTGSGYHLEFYADLMASYGLLAPEQRVQASWWFHSFKSKDGGASPMPAQFNSFNPRKHLCEAMKDVSPVKTLRDVKWTNSTLEAACKVSQNVALMTSRAIMLISLNPKNLLTSSERLWKKSGIWIDMGDTAALTAEERKAVWADVKFRLEYAKQKVAFKTFEAYFMKGKEPNLDPMKDDPIPLVYRLWLSHDQSLDAWVALTERFLAGPEAWTTQVSIEPTGDGRSWKELNKGHAWGWQIERSLADSYKILVQQAGARHYDGSEPYAGSDVLPPMGFMGGSEKRIYQFLNGQIPGSEHLLYKGKKLFDPAFNFGHIYYDDTCRWLDGTTPSNIYCLYNYVGPIWFRSMTADYMREIQQSEALQFYLNCFLVLLARYPEQGTDPERAAYCSELRQLLSAGPLLEPLKTLWDQAQSNRERVDLNAYMQDEPFYIGEF